MVKTKMQFQVAVDATKSNYPNNLKFLLTIYNADSVNLTQELPECKQLQARVQAISSKIADRTI